MQHVHADVDTRPKHPTSVGRAQCEHHRTEEKEEVIYHAIPPNGRRRTQRRAEPLKASEAGTRTWNAAGPISPGSGRQAAW